MPTLGRRAEAGTHLKRLGTDTALERLFTVVFDLLVDAFSYDSTGALIADGNHLDADRQKGDIAESQPAKLLRQLLTAATYPAQLSLALQDSELHNQERSAKIRSSGGQLETKLVAIGAARVGESALGGGKSECQR